MNADTYTKVVLTVIAVCLVVICVRDIRFVKDAHAASGPRYDYSGNLKVSIAEPTTSFGYAKVQVGP